ncbi:hypothetical protein OESDEN_23163 [Oesophagostomum dentatum]|uniref:Uncharacterized protein n=1 Tax=Oesophagostomum dentatum TaxID=61180 RepID=A0A0B1S156_OESDE|nr:hypothetical protein OESDEN_23163 [Oesophagostomum dentatum]
MVQLNCGILDLVPLTLVSALLIKHIVLM